MTVRHLLDEPHHDGSALYVPFGTPALGDVVPVRLRVPSSCTETGVHLRTVHDGEPVMSTARLERVTPHERWYVADVVVHNPVTGYRFLLDEPSGYRWLNGRGVHARDVTDAADFRLMVHEPAPAWSADAVVYQVFPDRFARSGAVREVPDWAEPAEWSDEPVGAGPSTPRQLYGGDLAGIEEHLDHLERLGVDVLYLTPFFPSRSNHRYDATSFDHVDPVLGGDEALASLSRAVHARGLRLMGDLTTNHTGAGHEWFQRAQADRSSQEATFYLWTDEPPGYVGWLGHDSLPKLDHRAPELAARLVQGPDSVIGRWLRPPYALDGWRIDVANMTGRWGATDLTHDVARTIRSTMTEVAPDALLVSEHFHDSSGDLPGDGWHVTMNYSAFTRPVWAWLASPDNPRTALGLPTSYARRPGATVVETMRDFDAVHPWRTASRQWNMLGSHDTPRLRTLVEDPALVEVAVGLLMTYPGTPVIFAGDEVGATGTNGEHGRVTMPWDEPGRWDGATFEVYRALIALRRSSAALRAGGLRWAVVADDALGFLRETADERVLVVVARAAWEGVDLPAHLLGSGRAPQTLYGQTDLHVGETLRVPGEGPGVGVWRL
ncbi:glycoside hydrolase family 13 protein [Actinotalea sp. K2]|uniref:glycoside hydrolase family 13 protein n=1 Tax=Actinotalea sp. K2 TaxID=2939438 RepID=UPI0020183345|nr:glycoside hydrolase family 13 protein [Actinotalea sp. K2]MCL3860621.1 glycoside hydrolase family 13 protein [Actinotalea sp. K2]